MFGETFKNKKILITGHTGFKGSWLSIWLHYLGANIFGLSDDVVSNPSNYIVSSIADFVNDFKVDIRNGDEVKSLINEIQPDFIFHLAAKALVKSSYKNPIDTFTSNVNGTVNILDALRNIEKKVIMVMITSDKAYDNVEWRWGYRENDRLGGKDPYSASKGMAEIAIRSYVNSFFNKPQSNIRLAVARAGNVIGGGDWATDRIVPDCVAAWANDKTVNIRSPHSTRPWQHVLEPLSGYLCLAKNLNLNNEKHGEAYNFGPQADQNYSVSKLIDEMSKYWNKVKWTDVSKSENHFHEASLLKLNCDKALFDLDWKPTLKFHETVKMTVEWYKEYYQNKNKSMHDFTISNINFYNKIAKKRNISWTNND
ncbi:CDP-glucose 4,6-dehydratase [Pelagibacteraceae bacterium]|nr:CDP-glucose 4,6-dehydratase [Pelagibacteraceae bacterium]